MNNPNDLLRTKIRALFLNVGFTVQKTSEMIEGMKGIDELSEELGELSHEAVVELNQLSPPLAGMIALTLDPNDPSVEENYRMLKDLLGELMRATYQLGKRDALQREDDKDLPN